MRQVAGQPEQLELEGERERVQRRACGERLELVEEVEETRQRLERARVRLLFGEEAQHRLRGEQADAEPVLLFARLMMRAEELHSRDGLQRARALIQHQLDVRERFEPRAEPGLRLADSLRDGTDASAVEGVDVQDAIGFAEPERAQHDRLGLVRASGHGSASLVPAVEGTFAGLSSLETIWPGFASIRLAGAAIASARKRCSRAEVSSSR